MLKPTSSAPAPETVGPPSNVPLYPPTEPHDVFSMDVGDRHRLYVEVSGNPEGRPAVVLHGGPGAGCLPDHRRFFDPEVYRIIAFDQRGAGRSTPLGSVERNTTSDLVADMERLRHRLGIEQWLLFGGSWGSTLALAYAADHPRRISAMVLRGTWLARPADIAWHMEGLRALAPDYGDDFVAPIPQDERCTLLEAYWRRLTASDPAIRLEAARTWCSFEQHFTTLFAPDDPPARADDQMLALARIEAHYFRNGCFLDPNRLIDALTNLQGTPGVIVHGRYDLLARLEGAWTLARAWPAAVLEIAPDAAHSIFEAGIRARLIAATDRFTQLSPWR